MIITHKIPWDKCLSHTLWEAINTGWKDADHDIHFFWGLAGNNIESIRRLHFEGEEWWYVDCGYMTEQITRYPEPKIHNKDTTYFRICKGWLHTTHLYNSNGKRRNELKERGIECEFPGWERNGQNILLCPSSPVFTEFVHGNGITQEIWCKGILKKYNLHDRTDIVFRNKPRPGNPWWNTNIKDDLRGKQFLICDMSLAGVDSILTGVPVLCNNMNVAFPVSFKPPTIEYYSDNQVNSWLDSVADNQFTLDEIADGTAWKVLHGVE